MLKRIRTAAESAGIIEPSLADAEKAAEQRRQDLVAARAAVDAAEQELQAAHERGAEPAEILRLEAAVASATLEAKRAADAHRGSERRLAKAQAAEREKARAAAVIARDAATGAYNKAAAEIDRLMAEAAEHMQVIDVQTGPFNEARRDGVAGLFTPVSGRTLAACALDRAVAELAGAYTADKPSAIELAARVTGAIKAIDAPSQTAEEETV
jgi:chromosome segregation ATPase